MSFESPWAFFLFFLLPGVGALLWWAFEHGKRDLVKVAGTWRSHRIGLVYLLKSFFSGVALLGALAFLILAISGPSWGSAPSEEGSMGLDVALAVDVSRSMLADDVKPTRLAKAAESLRFLAESLPGARFSLTITKGSAQVLLPLTQDLNALYLLLDSLGGGMLTSPGTDLADAVNKAASTLLPSSNRNQVLVLLSDGESKSGDLSQAARMAASKNITLLTLGFGTPEGGKIPLMDGEFIKDLFGQPVITSLNRSQLESASRDGHGAFYLGNEPGALTELLAKLNSLSSSTERGGIKLQPVGRYRLFLLFALGAFALFILVRVIKWQKVF